MADVANSISSSNTMNTASPILSEGQGLISPKVMEAMDRIFPESTSELFDKSPTKNGKKDSVRRHSDRGSVNADVNGDVSLGNEKDIDSPVVPSEASPAVPSTERRIISKIKIPKPKEVHNTDEPDESKKLKDTVDNLDVFYHSEDRDSDDMTRPFTKKKKDKKRNANESNHHDKMNNDGSDDSEEEFQQNQKKIGGANNLDSKSSKSNMNNDESHIQTENNNEDNIKDNRLPSEISNCKGSTNRENTSTPTLESVEFVTVPSRAHSGIKLPVPRKKIFHIHKDSHNMKRTFPECYVVLKKYKEFPQNCDKETWSEIEKMLPLNVRMKLLKQYLSNTETKKISRQRKKATDSDNRYKNIFEENDLSEDDFQVTRGGKSLRRRNKPVNYRDDVIDIDEESKNEDKDPNYTVDSDSDSDSTKANKRNEGSHHTIVGQDGQTQVYVYPNSTIAPTTLFANSTLQTQPALVGQPMAAQLNSTSSTGVRPQYCMMKVDGKDMLVQLQNGPGGMQQVMTGGKRYVLSSQQQQGVTSGPGVVMAPATVAPGAPGAPGVLLQSANRVPAPTPAPAAAPTAPVMRPGVPRNPWVSRNRNPVPGPDDVIWELLNKSQNTDRATCKFCSEVFMIHNSTTSILRHMQKKHPQEIKRVRQRREEEEKKKQAERNKELAAAGATNPALPAIRPALAAQLNSMVGRNNRLPAAGPNDVIWELMTRSEKQDRASCKHCKEVFMIHNSTTAILRHLQKAHPQEIKAARQRREELLQKEAQKNAPMTPMLPMGRGTMGMVGGRPSLIPPSQGLQPGRNLRVYVPGCSVTNTPAHFTMLATMPSSSPLTRLSASSSLLPQRKRVAEDTLTPEQKAEKRRRLEKKYPLPPGVVIKTEPEEATVTHVAPAPMQPGMRSLLQTSIQSMFVRPQGPGGMQHVRISPQLASALSTRHAHPGSNVMIRAGTGGQTLLVPMSVSAPTLTAGVTASSLSSTTTVSSSGPPHVLSTSSTSATNQTVIAQQTAIDNLRALVKAQESRGLTGDRLDKLRILLEKKEADLKALQESLAVGSTSTPPPPSLSPNPNLVDPVDGSIGGTENDPFVID